MKPRERKPASKKVIDARRAHSLKESLEVYNEVVYTPDQKKKY
jgi:hypothetical protein